MGGQSTGNQCPQRSECEGPWTHYPGHPKPGVHSSLGFTQAGPPDSIPDTPGRPCSIHSACRPVPGESQEGRTGQPRTSHRPRADAHAQCPAAQARPLPSSSDPGEVAALCAFLEIFTSINPEQLASDPCGSCLWLLQSDCEEKLSDTHQTSRLRRWTALITTFSFPEELSIK